LKVQFTPPPLLKLQPTYFSTIVWFVYDIDKFSFYTSTKDQKSTMKNSVVTLEVESMHFASLKYNNHVMAK